MLKICMAILKDFFHFLISVCTEQMHLIFTIYKKSERQNLNKNSEYFTPLSKTTLF